MTFAIGDFGHLFVIISFLSAIVATISWWAAHSNKDNLLEQKPWLRLARAAFITHSLAVFGIIISLFTIIYTHNYRYHYAWSHSNNYLAVEYMISCFWEGQEGSFLLWIFWQVIIGLILIAKPSKWEAPVMVIVAAVQAFLSSMILGAVIGDLKIGSSPFILLKDAMPDIPVFQTNPDFVPEDGRGLNPLLQNYWMVIHPPTLFLGFALCLVPFAYAIAGLWLKEFSAWIKPALNWSLMGAAVLGLGIMMGAYWAYETLNFGGYWNWDPVENAVYIPWLTLVATIHCLISYQKNRTLLKTGIFMAIITFLLVLYATFLTRSGILGEASVHSFTDLGLSGQLLIYLMAFVVFAVVLMSIRWKQIPGVSKELSIWSGEFWIFLGILTLSLASFQVLSFTSIPVYNAIAKVFGIELNMAPPADQIATYGAWQMWFGLSIVFLSSIGQIFWWNRMSKENLTKIFYIPIIAGLLLASGIIYFGKIDKIDYLLFTIGVCLAVTMNAAVLIKLISKNTKLTGGAIAHLGVGMMLLGILFSSGYSKVISLNNSGLVYRKEFNEEMNRDNILLWRGSKTAMSSYNLTYKGDCYKVLGFPTYVKKEFLGPTDNDYFRITRGPLEYQGKIYFKKGDTVEVEPENTYFAVQYVDAAKNDTFMLFPRAQVNPSMGLLASPDVKKFASRDLYSHVSSIPKPDEEKEWSETEDHAIAKGDTFIVNDFVAQLVDVAQISELDNYKLKEGEAGVKAIIRVFGLEQNYIAEPQFIITKSDVGRIPAAIPELGLKFTLMNIDPKTEKFVIGVNTSQKDWIILKVMEKPGINLLWMGTLVVLAGFGLSWARRINTEKLAVAAKNASGSKMKPVLSHSHRS